MQESYTNEQVDRFCQIAEDNGKRWGAMEERIRISKLLINETKIPSDVVQSLIERIEETE